MNKFRRVGVYLNPEEYKMLRVKLAMNGKTVSSWIREKIQEYLQS